MSCKAKLPLITLLSIYLCIYVESSPQHCTSDLIRKYAADACNHIVGHVSKRQTDLSDYGYFVQNVKTYHHNHDMRAKKLTHPKFPSGGYLLIHYPHAHSIYSSNNNQILENSSEEISNDILTQDMNHDAHHVVKRRTHGKQARNKFNAKHKRNTNASSEKPVGAACCRQSCDDLFCH